MYAIALVVWAPAVSVNVPPLAATAIVYVPPMLTGLLVSLVGKALEDPRADRDNSFKGALLVCGVAWGLALPAMLLVSVAYSQALIPIMVLVGAAELLGVPLGAVLGMQNFELPRRAPARRSGCWPS